VACPLVMLHSQTDEIAHYEQAKEFAQSVDATFLTYEGDHAPQGQAALLFADQLLQELQGLLH